MMIFATARRPLHGLSSWVALLAFVGSPAALAAACSAKEAAAPSVGTYTIAFPSTAAAIATDSVKVYVFDVGDAAIGDTCPNLVLARRSNQALPTPLVEAAPVSPCDLAAGRGQVTVPYGVRAVLAVGRKGAKDLLIGCAIQNIGEGSTQVPVQLALASTTVDVPSTACANLSDRCAGRCP